MRSAPSTNVTRFFAAASVAFALLFPLAACAQNTPILPLDTGNWAATDNLGRSLPLYEQVGPPKANRWVGLFYWQWHGRDRWGPDYNMTEFLKTHPGFKDFNAFPPGGPNHPTWYWAEPLFGYYSSKDPWVIRKHLAMLADAGVDFLFLDYTNGSIYDDELKALLDVSSELVAKGVAVPRLVFFLNHEPEWKIEALYKTWYRPGKFDDRWFRWAGKPLMMAPMPTDSTKLKDPSLLPAIQAFFTFRPTWAFQDAAKEPTKWRFMDDLKGAGMIRPALGPDGKPEQIVVNKSTGGPIWNNMTSGAVSTYPGHVPVYNDQWLSSENAKGLFFQYMWENALKSPAPILLVTGWNEWTASVWETPGVVMLGRKTVKGQGHIVDEFNQDFNRDLEPMKGGYGDDYYYQFVANMRRYKGVRAPEPTSPPTTLPVDGSLSAWDDVTPHYRDAEGDTANRDFPGVTPGAHYNNTSARNDIVAAQAARDNQMLYFHVRTAAPLSPAAGASWMTLYIDSDTNAATGWNGYDFRINGSRTGAICTVERNVGNTYTWKRIGAAQYRAAGKDLVIAVPRALIGLGVAAGRPLQFDFKWADNLPAVPAVMDFYQYGDVAPDARFNYRYRAASPK
jgi:hypothetical protein